LKAIHLTFLIASLAWVLAAGLPCFAAEAAIATGKPDAVWADQQQVAILRAQLEGLQSSQGWLLTIVGAGFAIPVAVMLLLAGYNWLGLPRRLHDEREALKTEMLGTLAEEIGKIEHRMVSLVKAAVADELRPISAESATLKRKLVELECEIELHMGSSYLSDGPLCLAKPSLIRALHLAVDLQDDRLGYQAVEAVKSLAAKILGYLKGPSASAFRRDRVLPSEIQQIRELLARTNPRWNEEAKLEVLQVLGEIEELPPKAV
jgi:hypothetical protein